ncbi:alpha/beta hydrolase [Tolypothrix sp. PCC 7910]|uniref:alpha/beta fold hydrolase n=1 Tax=Tolypothrix sp. PCC 7910 TaxID=2099387 RepID=UPI0014279C00|nr:alpha/beta hydrolase [Tolypothrix sp. PCC 7910]QIR39125.1 alpha/beta hydrolase [Tolypothrix sp. PCC 7910]
MDLHYEIQGKGDAIALIHSGGADLRDWLFIAPELAKKYQVITFDGRGAGKSPPPLEPANYVEDLRKLLDHLGIYQVILVGHSIGGEIATDFALTYPQRVSKLVLVAPGLTGFEFSPQLQQWFEEIRAAAPDVEKMVKLNLEHSIYQTTVASPQRDLLYQMFKHNIERYFEWQSFEQVWPQPPAISRLHELKTKTLFMIGTKDSEDLFRIVELFKQVPDIRFAEIEGADHLPTLTHPAEVTNLISDFLSE